MQQDLDVAVVGAGPAGLSAALYAARARLTAVVLERMGAGGQLVNVDRIENYPGFPAGIAGYELSAQLASHAMNAGANLVYEDVQSIAQAGRYWLVRTDAANYQCRAVILAVGSQLVRLGLPGEQEFEGRGVSYCAVCDGGFVANQEVVVIGGGDSALDEAEYLSTICSRVYLVHRRAELRAARVLQERARANPRIALLLETNVQEIRGGTSVEAVFFRDLQSGSERRLAVAGVFIYAGLRPNTRFLADVVPLDAGGHISTDAGMATPVAGLFAAGDIRQHSARQIASCVGDGVTAAVSVERYVRGLE